MLRCPQRTQSMGGGTARVPLLLTAKMRVLSYLPPTDQFRIQPAKKTHSTYSLLDALNSEQFRSMDAASISNRLNSMKKKLIPLTLALLTSVTSHIVSANTGTINFVGKIDSSTCPIEVVNPDSQATSNEVKMGTVSPSRFTAIGQEYLGNDFILRVPADAGCNLIPGNVGTVTFTGTADASGNFYATKSYTGAAKGVAIVIKDRTGQSVNNGTQSAEYPLSDTVASDMKFDAYYVSTAATVQPGPADADVNFLVTIN